MCEVRRYKSTPNVRIDKCMRGLIGNLKQLLSYIRKGEYKIVACCCGHKKYPMSIIIQWGVKDYYVDIVSGKSIPGKRLFYKKDEEGYYYIPEVNQSKEGICECGHTQWTEHKSSFYEYKGLKMKAQECNVKGCKCKKFKLDKGIVAKRKIL